MVLPARAIDTVAATKLEMPVEVLFVVLAPAIVEDVWFKAQCRPPADEGQGAAFNPPNGKSGGGSYAGYRAESVQQAAETVPGDRNRCFTRQPSSRLQPYAGQFQVVANGRKIHGAA